MTADAFQRHVAVIDELLAARAAVYPRRDAAHERLQVAIAEFTAYLLRTTPFQPFEPEVCILQEIERFRDNPIFICGPMKSGTTLMTQLLDGHPALMVIPGDSHYVNHSGRWSRTDFEAVATHWLQKLVNPTGKEPFWFLGRKRTVYDTFLRYLKHFIEKTQEDIFLCAVCALYTANRSLLSPGKILFWVEKTPENERHAQALGQRFPNARFVQIIRDPLPNAASLLRAARAYGWEASTRDFSVLLHELFQVAQRNLRRLGAERYVVSRYEDLIANPHAAMARVASFCGIQFTDSLLVPTENGRPGTANSMYADRRVKGRILAEGGSDRYRQELSASQTIEIVSRLYDDALAFGYDWDRPEVTRYRRSRIARLLSRASGPFLADSHS